MEITIIDEQMEKPYEQMKKLYEQINERYKTINRELINKIMHRFSEIIALYNDFTYTKTHYENGEEKEKGKSPYLLDRIFKIEEISEPSNIKTVLSIINMTFYFMCLYDHNCLNLFRFPFYQDWMLYNGNNLIWDEEIEYWFNDQNIPSITERFFSISDKEIWYLLMLNFPEFKYEKTNKYRDFDGTHLPYPSSQLTKK